MSFDFGNANQQQREAITCTEGPLLIIAGPGTGKTFTLVKRIVYLITELHVQPEEIMVATFAEEAAKELVTRVSGELIKVGAEVNVDEMYIGTFHSICLRLLNENLEFARIKKNYRVLEQFEQQYMIFSSLKKFREIPNYSLLLDQVGPWQEAAKIAAYVNGLKEELIDCYAMLEERTPQLEALAGVACLYEQLMQERNMIDFSSIQTETYWMLKKNPQILSELQQKIRYLMVDEYQDTNYIQETLVLLLAGERKNICVVGDDDQGLYRFRGATIRNILQFPNHFEEGICKRVYLTNNYRSEKQIIEFYNDWMDDTYLEGKNREFYWGQFRYPKNIVPGKQEYNNPISVVKCSAPNEIEQWYRRVYEFIESLRKKGILTDYNQVAFLCRSVKDKKILGLIQYLEQRGVPVYSPRSERFFNRSEIKQIIGCILLCFKEAVDIVRDPDFIQYCQHLDAYYNEECILAAKRLVREHPDTLGRWMQQRRQEHEREAFHVDYALTGLLYQLLEFEPFHSYVEVDPGDGMQDERPARNMAILMSCFGKFENMHGIERFTPGNYKAVLKRFFQWYLRFLYEDGIREYEYKEEYAPKGCVSFMTIHQSKGKEFPVVIVDSLDKTPWSRKSVFDSVMKMVEEKYAHRPAFEPVEDIHYHDFWRLYYTAFSRAQNLLVLSCCESRGKYPVPSPCFAYYYDRLREYDQVDLSNLQLESIKPVNVKNQFSFTAHVGVYERCPLRYKFFKEFEFKETPVVATVFGSLVHQTIEDIHRAVIQNEEETITPENVHKWMEENYALLAKVQHIKLGEQQREAAYKHVMRYVTRNAGSWDRIEDAEVEVSIVNSKYVLQGKVDLIRRDGDCVEVVDFKSEKKPNLEEGSAAFDRYRRQLEVYAYLIEERLGKKVSKMHLYYTGEDGDNPTITFDKSKESIRSTMQAFDQVVEEIEHRNYAHGAITMEQCRGCDMRFYCRGRKQ